MDFSKKHTIRKFLRFLPHYRKISHLLENDIHNDDMVHSSILAAINNVPYYKRYEQLYHSLSDFKELPIIRKADIMGREKEFVSKKACKLLLQKKETGGSTGLSLELFYSHLSIINKVAFSDFLFSRCGKSKNIATLRGNRPKEDKIIEVIDSSSIILSSYKLNKENLDVYIDALNRYKIDCLHVYPSSLSVFARLLKQRKEKISLPYLKKVIASSEIFSKEDKCFVKELFPDVHIIDFYGHNELACAAISIDNTPYRFIPAYGYVEFIETGEFTPQGNRIAEIVATSILNSDMPFIRYATDDYVELDKEGNPISIIGRTSDFIVNKKGQIQPCIISTRTKSMENVIAFQYYQERIGELIYKIKVSDDYSSENQKYLLEDLNTSFSDMDCRIQIVDEIEKTARGKQLRMIQKINLNDYKK